MHSEIILKGVLEETYVPCSRRCDFVLPSHPLATSALPPFPLAGSVPRDMYPTPASASPHCNSCGPQPTTDRPLPPHMTRDPEALECPVAGCRYDAHLHAPVRTPLCPCGRLVCRQCVLAAASSTSPGPCGACGRSGDVRAEAEWAGVLVVDGGVLAVLGAVSTVSTVSRWVSAWSFPAHEYLVAASG